MRWYSHLGLLGKLVVPWTGAIVLTVIAVWFWLWFHPGVNYGGRSSFFADPETAAFGIGLLVWTVGLGVLRFIADFVKSRRHRTEPRPRQF